jgi:hypothetical protein
MPRFPGYRDAAPTLRSQLGKNLVHGVLGVGTATGCVKTVALFVIQNCDVQRRRQTPMPVRKELSDRS